MTIWIINFFLTFIISVLLTGLIIPKILLIAFRRQLFDEVDERKIHRGVVPRLGGIAFLPAIAFSFCMVLGLNLQYNPVATHLIVGMSELRMIYGICAIMLIYLVGMGDDLVGVRYSAKFLFQIGAAIMIVASGLQIDNFYGLFFIHEVSPWVGIPLSMLLIIYIINAVNLIDGIDGLASGLTAMALIAYSIVFFNTGEFIFAMVAGATIGTLVPFFWFNVFGRAEKHTKIFMGDTGSLTIGVIVSFLTLAIVGLHPEPLSRTNTAILAIAPLILPCFDVVRVFLHRVKRGRNPFLPDTTHIHHKLLALGLPQWKALILILVADALFIVINVILSVYVQPTWILAGDILIWTDVNIWLTRLIREREQRLGIKLFD